MAIAKTQRKKNPKEGMIDKAVIFTASINPRRLKPAMKAYAGTHKLIIRRKMVNCCCESIVLVGWLVGLSFAVMTAFI